MSFGNCNRRARRFAGRNERRAFPSASAVGSRKLRMEDGQTARDEGAQERPIDTIECRKRRRAGLRAGFAPAPAGAPAAAPARPGDSGLSAVGASAKGPLV
jgi:hypothetical protein